eukprot:TRINITY_DN3705_c0_g2_i2.p1 TRINITY_DN3705_c0_g2~~TRINITY_DN3705_c0_g2_i2.p1  ORF type:complete len:100 (-),score=13.19 TRINITY_DN3705_c0_g2_i2:17-316(-)
MGAEVMVVLAVVAGVDGQNLHRSWAWVEAQDAVEIAVKHKTTVVLRDNLTEALCDLPTAAFFDHSLDTVPCVDNLDVAVVVVVVTLRESLLESFPCTLR